MFYPTLKKKYLNLLKTPSKSSEQLKNKKKKLKHNKKLVLKLRVEKTNNQLKIFCNQNQMKVSKRKKMTMMI